MEKKSLQELKDRRTSLALGIASTMAEINRIKEEMARLEFRRIRMAKLLGPMQQEISGINSKIKAIHISVVNNSHGLF